MRAGLLSRPEVIERVNRTFVSTWILIDDLERLAAEKDALAVELAVNWDYPIDLMFVSPEGKLVNKLNSFRDFRNPHPDVGQPAHLPWGGPTHEEIFMTHLETHFPSPATDQHLRDDTSARPGETKN